MTSWQGFSGSSGQWIHQNDIMTWRRVYRGHGAHIAAARKFPALLLAETGRADDAEWIARELISNAIKYTRSGHRHGWFGIKVRLAAQSARIGIHDQGGSSAPQIAPLPTAQDLPEHGMRLRGVAELAAWMGIKGSPESGHMVWAELDLATEPNRATG